MRVEAAGGGEKAVETGLGVGAALVEFGIEAVFGLEVLPKPGRAAARSEAA